MNEEKQALCFRIKIDLSKYSEAQSRYVSTREADRAARKGKRPIYLPGPLPFSANCLRAKESPQAMMRERAK
jgi:hypothetical protein